jgi:hypothetical protein
MKRRLAEASRIEELDAALLCGRGVVNGSRMWLASLNIWTANGAPIMDMVKKIPHIIQREPTKAPPPTDKYKELRAKEESVVLAITVTDCVEVTTLGALSWATGYARYGCGTSGGGFSVRPISFDRRDLPLSSWI